MLNLFNWSRGRRRVVADFLSATENEIYLDSLLFSLGGASPEKLGFFPRPTKWVSLAKKHPRASFVAWRLVRLAWLGGGGLVFFLWQYFRMRPGAGFRKKQSSAYLENSGYVLALSTRVGDIIHAGNIPDLPANWVTLPWVPLRQIPTNVNVVDLMELLDAGDLARALRDAVCSIYISRNRQQISPWVLQTYTAFRWFVVRAAIDKLPGDLLMAEHFDRWAVLVDGSARCQRFVDPASGIRCKRKLTLVQHGSLGSLGSNNNIGAVSRLDLPRKLHAVAHLYAYDRGQEMEFKNSVLSPESAGKIEISYYQSRIELRKVADYSGVKILFVGHPVCEALHMHLYESLRTNYMFKAYYKPHPLSPMSAKASAIDWEVIREPHHFPEVDMLISYPSTLVVEYSGAGISAVVHPIDMPIESSNDLMASIAAKLKTVCPPTRSPDS